MKEVLYSRLLNQATDSVPTPQAANYVFPDVHRRQDNFYRRASVLRWQAYDKTL